MISKEEYVERVMPFRTPKGDIVVHQSIGRAPEENTLFVNWNESWWKGRDQIVEEMEKEILDRG